LPGFDFDDDQLVVLFGNDIDLILDEAVIGRTDRIAFFLEVPLREALSVDPELLLGHIEQGFY
jgi:hypothetical protein